jgi:hypothetical protein
MNRIKCVTTCMLVRHTPSETETHALGTGRNFPNFPSHVKPQINTNVLIYEYVVLVGRLKQYNL